MAGCRESRSSVAVIRAATLGGWRSSARRGPPDYLGFCPTYSRSSRSCLISSRGLWFGLQSQCGAGQRVYACAHVGGTASRSCPGSRRTTLSLRPSSSGHGCCSGTGSVNWPSGEMSDSGGGLSRSPAGHNRDTVSDSCQNVVHGQNESVDAIDAQEPGARLARVENCKGITR